LSFFNESPGNQIREESTHKILESTSLIPEVGISIIFAYYQRHLSDPNAFNVKDYDFAFSGFLKLFLKSFELASSLIVFNAISMNMSD